MKTIFDNLFFDLDGTLTDPFEGITRSVEYALGKFGIEVADRRELVDFIGPPLIQSFKTRYGFSQADAERCVLYYRERFSTVGLFENAVYDGIPQTLETFRSCGKKLYVATSKPEVFAIRILDKFELTRFFDGVYGASLDSSRLEKADVLAYALSESKAEKPRSIMIGDRRFDVEGGRANGIKTVGVLYGYGDINELKRANADYLAPAPEDITKIIL